MSDFETSTGADRRRARREVVVIGVFCLLAAGSGLAGLWLTSTAAIRDTYNLYLVSVARTAAQFVDADLHERLRDPGQRNGPDYLRAVAPLRKLVHSAPDVHYIYTMVHSGDEYRFVLDAAMPGDLDGDGVDDQAGVWELYEDVDPMMAVVFGNEGAAGRVVTTDQPYADKWGNFMTAWAPLYDAEGRQYGALGVDVSADDYVGRLAAARQSALLGLLPAVLLIGGLCLLFYRIRLRSLEASREAAAQARALALEQHRLQDIVEATSAGTWGVRLGARREDDEFTIDERWAGMFGYRREELMPMTSLGRVAMTHQDDVERVQQEFFASLTDPDRPFVAEMRVRHRDGHWVWAETRGRVVERDWQGRPVRMAGMLIDISERKRIQLALQESESSLRSLFELSPAGICLADMNTGQFLKVNDSLVNSTGYSRDELLQISYKQLTPPEWHEFERQQLTEIHLRSNFGPYEKEYQRKDGSRYPVLISGLSTYDSTGRHVAWAIVQDISERKAMELELADAARRDRLTGLANRALFMEWLQAAIVRTRLGVQCGYAVLFLDFDRFKLVNDAMGHECGDSLLRDIAARLGETLGQRAQLKEQGFLVARFGGDEFLVLLNDVSEPHQVRAVAHELLQSLARPYAVQGREVYSTASIGIVMGDRGPSRAEDVVRNADVAMYEAKRSGRARAVLFDASMQLKLTRHVMVESCLRKSLDTSEISLVYQPVVELGSGRITSVEALARWTHPVLGEVSPGEFIPVAEESGLIVPLGRRVLREACHTLAGLRRTHGPRAPLTIGVNISRAELAQGEHLLEEIRAALEESGLPPECLLLEVTEREVMHDPTAAQRVMHALRGLGVRLAMDDFGTGTSSLDCLRDYPFDIIKVDRSFVRDMAASPDMLAVIHATITLVENLGRSSVAEGVETSEQVAVLQALGCHYAQGYHFSPPLPAEELAALLLRAGDSALPERPSTRASA